MKRIMIVSTICFAMLSFLFVGVAHSDTVLLDNGNTIHGKVVHRHSKSETHVKLSFSNGGWMLVPKYDVARITPDNTDQFEDRNAGSGGPED